MFGGRKHSAQVVISDPTADRVFPILRVPEGETLNVTDWWASADVTLAAGTTNFWGLRLLKLNSGGTTSGTLASGTIGGTVGWTAAAIKDGAITASPGTVAAGEFVAVEYDETGTVAPLNIVVGIEFRRGR